MCIRTTAGHSEFPPPLHRRGNLHPTRWEIKPIDPKRLSNPRCLNRNKKGRVGQQHMLYRNILYYRPGKMFSPVPVLRWLSNNVEDELCLKYMQLYGRCCLCWFIPAFLITDVFHTQNLQTWNPFHFPSHVTFSLVMWPVHTTWQSPDIWGEENWRRLTFLMLLYNSSWWLKELRDTWDICSLAQRLYPLSTSAYSTDKEWLYTRSRVQRPRIYTTILCFLDLIFIARCGDLHLWSISKRNETEVQVMKVSEDCTITASIFLSSCRNGMAPWQWGRTHCRVPSGSPWITLTAFWHTTSENSTKTTAF